MGRADATVTRIDGRRRRSEQSRAQIVQAMMELIGGGEVAPGAEAVAATAGVGLRTVFRHFDNMETLYQELNAAVSAEVMPILEAPYETTDWRDQLNEMIGRRVRVFERIMPFKISAEAHRHRSPFLTQQAETLVRRQRSALADILPKAVKSDDVLFQALDLALSFDSWKRLRREQRLSIAKARATIERTAQSLLAGA